MTVNLSGEIMPTEWAEVYRWFGWTDNCCPKDIADALEAANGEDLELLVNSPGGDLFSAREMLSALRRYQGKITATVTSIAASAATVAMMGADVIRAEPYATICIHNPSCYAEGDAGTHRKTARELDVHRDSIVEAYLLHSSRSREELIRQMDKDVWMTAQEAVDFGIVDELTEAEGGERIAAAKSYRGAPPQKLVDAYNAAREAERVQALENERERAKLELFLATCD